MISMEDNSNDVADTNKSGFAILITDLSIEKKKYTFSLKN